MKSPVSSISSAGLRGTLRDERDHRGRAEQAVFDARGGEAGVGGGERQIARRDQLAARGGGDAVDQRDHRLRQPGQREHHLRGTAPNSSTSRARSRSPAISLRSWPAQNARPLPVITTTRTPGSSLIASSSACSAGQQLARERVVLVGRLRVSPATPSASLRNSTGSAAGSTSTTASSISAASAITLSPDPRASREIIYRSSAPAQIQGRLAASPQPCAAAARRAFHASITRFACPAGATGISACGSDARVGRMPACAGGSSADGAPGARRRARARAGAVTLARRALHRQQLLGGLERAAFDRHVLALQAHAAAEIERDDDAEQRPEAVGHQLVGARDLGKAQRIERRQHEEGADAQA